MAGLLCFCIFMQHTPEGDKSAWGGEQEAGWGGGSGGVAKSVLPGEVRWNGSLGWVAGGSLHPVYLSFGGSRGGRPTHPR